MQGIVLGLNCSHDASACLVLDGQIIVAIAEERLTRIKHQFGFPQKSIEYCLQVAGLDPLHLGSGSLVVINQLPPADFDRDARASFPNLNPSQIIVNPSHHLLHASYAQLFLRDNSGVILVVDGSGYSFAEHARRNSPLLGPPPPYGDMCECLTAYEGVNAHDLTLLLKDWGEWKAQHLFRFPSLGHMYSSAAQKIFGSWTHAGKVMGLAPYGDHSKIGISEIVQLGERSISVDTDWIFKIPDIPFTEHFEANNTASDLAALVQYELERGLLHLCKLLRSRSSSSTICLTGGVALNSVFNGRLQKEKLFENAYFTPAASDAGVAIGGAVYGHKLRTGHIPAFASDAEFLGKNYELNEIDQAINAAPSDLVITTCPDKMENVAEDICNGWLVGWFEGKSEFGPRALGHRSILADPRGAHIKALLNSTVKFRESFRPYAAAVLSEYVNDWFDLDVESPHMLMVAAVRSPHHEAIPAVVHCDNTCRLQTLKPTFQGDLRSIVEKFYDKTNVPLVLNTSLNIHGEPTAESPYDALQVLLRSGLNVLYIGPYRVTKKFDIDIFPLSLATLKATPSAPYTVRSSYPAQAHGITSSVTRVVEQGNRRLQITRDEAILLENLHLLDNERGQSALLNIVDGQDIVAIVRQLTQKGVLQLK